MTAPDRLAQLPAAEFVAVWNGAATLDEVVQRVGDRVGRVPRWAMMARAVAVKMEGPY